MGYVCQLNTDLVIRWWDMFLVQEVVAWLMVQEVTLVEALLGMERSSERSRSGTEDSLERLHQGKRHHPVRALDRGDAPARRDPGTAPERT